MMVVVTRVTFCCSFVHPCNLASDNDGIIADRQEGIRERQIIMYENSVPANKITRRRAFFSVVKRKKRKQIACQEERKRKHTKIQPQNDQIV